MSYVWDVVVIGLGPAGAATAYQAASCGLRVLGIDRAIFPRDKVCGGCVSHRALPYLKAIGAGPNVYRNSLPLRWAELRAGSVRTRLSLPAGLIISRHDLDIALLQKAQAAGAEILTGYEARIGEYNRGSRRVQLIF